MLDLASKQLAILEKNQGQVYASEIDDLLRQRKDILDEINENNQKNKQLQQKIVKELGIEEFVLGQLESNLESAHYQALNEQISNLSQLLEKISEKDQRSQELMQQAILIRLKLEMTTGKLNRFIQVPGYFLDFFGFHLCT